MLTPSEYGVRNVGGMGRPSRIYKGRTPHRIHFIPEWAERRGLKQADVARELAVDKSSVSRWWKGALPETQHLEPLARFLGAEQIGDLFVLPKKIGCFGYCVVGPQTNDSGSKPRSTPLSPALKRVNHS